ncbi:MAG: hypothetical protein U1F98_09535 [Verrucomicrobiota bacterium]
MQDSNIWGFIAIPIGLTVCFGPALLLWLKQESAADTGDKPKDH